MSLGPNLASHSVKDYLEETNVQLGASYNVAKQSTDSYNKGLAAAAGFVGADVDDIGIAFSPSPSLSRSFAKYMRCISVIGPSTTQLFANLSLILNLPPHSELVLSSLDHEANISPWVRLAKLNDYTIKWWTPQASESTATTCSPVLTPENLRTLLSKKTALVACTHASNVLGTIHDIKAIAEEVHKIPGAKLCVDGVALAPHREVDVKALGADFYSFSWYKVLRSPSRVYLPISLEFVNLRLTPLHQVYGPHIAILYASRTAQRNLGSLGHYFHTGTDLTTKLGLASASYELVASLPRVVSYFGPSKQSAWAAIALHEEKLQEILLGYLRKREDINIYGKTVSDRALRVPVVSFVVKGRRSREVVEEIEKRSNFGCRWGHFYSKRLVDEFLELGSYDGVVRVSMVHYNTSECSYAIYAFAGVMLIFILCSGGSGKVRQGAG